MKNKLTLLTNIFIFGISLFSSITYTGITVYLQNNYKSPVTGYGMTLNYKVSSAQPEGKYVGSNVRVSLGEVDFIPELSIRETGTGSSWVSYYYPLNYFLTDIKNQQTRHANDDAIIVVGPNSTLSTWDIKLYWEPKNKSIKPFEFSDFNQPKPIGVPKVQPAIPEPIQVPAHMINYEQEEALMAITTAEGRLNRIKNGALGQDYARKATEICSANYSQAEKLGKINLCSELKRNLMAPIYRIDPRAQKKRGFVSPDLAPATDDIKRSINTLHGAFIRYKDRGEAS